VLTNSQNDDVFVFMRNEFISLCNENYLLLGIVLGKWVELKMVAPPGNEPQ
jgi:hypothetical protein